MKRNEDWNNPDLFGDFSTWWEVRISFEKVGAQVVERRWPHGLTQVRVDVYEAQYTVFVFTTRVRTVSRDDAVTMATMEARNAMESSWVPTETTARKLTAAEQEYHNLGHYTPVDWWKLLLARPMP